ARGQVLEIDGDSVALELIEVARRDVDNGAASGRGERDWVTIDDRRIIPGPFHQTVACRHVPIRDVYVAVRRVDAHGEGRRDPLVSGDSTEGNAIVFQSHGEDRFLIVLRKLADCLQTILPNRCPVPG